MPQPQPPENGAKPLSVTISLSNKIGLPNYGSAEAFLSISNVTAETTSEEIDVMLDQGGLAWSKMAARIRQKVQEIKQEQGV